VTRLLRASICVASIVLSAGLAQAEGIANGQITSYTAGASGGEEFLLVYITSITGAPSCSTGSRFIMSAAAPNYKSTLAIVMASYHSGATVTVRGLGTCSLWSNTEDLSYVCPGTLC
jgi:hypothetical protein